MTTWRQVFDEYEEYIEGRIAQCMEDARALKAAGYSSYCASVGNAKHYHRKLRTIRRGRMAGATA